MKYSEWVETVPGEIREDALWKQEAYRLALFAADLGWHDTTKLFRDGRTLKLAAQLFDAVCSVGANISEGYSRGHQKDRARFYEYALGSARESRTWYFDGRHVLGETVVQHRIRLHTQITRLLLKMLPLTRGYTLHECDTPNALIMSDELIASNNPEPLSPQELHHLLEHTPLPERQLRNHATRNTQHA